MDVITKILNVTSLLTVVKCTIELIKFLRWDEWYSYKMSSNNTISWPESLWEDIFYDLGLLLLFVGLHRLMSYTRSQNKVDLMPVSGPIHVTISSLTLLVLVTYWHYIRTVTIWSWDVSSYPLLLLFFRLFYAFAWGILILENVVYITQRHILHIKHIFNLKDNFPAPLPSHLANLWECFPHPGLITFTVILWVTPTLTLDRWLLATVLTWYIFIPRRVTKKDYIYFCECYNYVQHSDARLSY